MNLSSLKKGFREYLQDLENTKGASGATNTSNPIKIKSAVSIFEHSEEFKDYISEEFGADSNILSMDLKDILKLDIVDGKFVLPEEETATDKDSGEVEEVDVEVDDSEEATKSETEEFNTCDLLNELFEDEEVIELLDSDKSGDLSEEEILGFLESIKNNDGNEDDISFDDIALALKDAGIVEDEVKVEDVQTPQVQTSSPTSAGGGSYSPGGSYNAGSSPSNEPQEKTLDNMSVDELNSELQTANSDLTEKQGELSKAQNGETPTLIADKQAVDDAYEAYQNAIKEVDEELAQKVDDKKNEIDAKEKEISDKESEIFAMEQNITALRSAYDAAKSSYETLNAQLSEMNGMLNSVEGEQKSNLQAKIDGLTTKVAEAKTAMEKAETDLNKAEKEDLPELKAQKSVLDAALLALNTEMTILQTEVNEKCPEAKELYEAYTSAKEKLEADKQTEVEKAQKDVETAQAHVNEVQSALTAAQTRETQKEYSPITSAEDILAYADTLEGMTESQVEAICGYNLPDGLWCAAFVEFMLNAKGGDNVADWYKNIDNKAGCGNVKRAAWAAGTDVDINQVQPGYLAVFNWPENGGNKNSEIGDHIGFVVKVENGIVYTIEGNTGNGIVAYNQYNLDFANNYITFCNPYKN